MICAICLVKTVEPLRFRGNEVILFQVLYPQEIAPHFREPVLLTDMETSGTMEVSPEYRAANIGARSTSMYRRCATRPKAPAWTTS